MRLLAKKALLPHGWADDVLIETDPQGLIVTATPAATASSDAERVDGFVIPGMPNLHSHAFQRAMAGLTESRGNTVDSFWTWRDLMYRFAATITADQLQAIATHLYMEMLKAGYTSVAEFHYLHHDRGGNRCADPGEMSHRLIAAARDAGIAITLLPVLYAYGGFGAQPPMSGQARFVHSAPSFLELFGTLRASYGHAANIRVGAAFHSLRAVAPRMMTEVIAALDAVDATAPIHLHIAEQAKEVEACLHWSGKRSVEWLLDNVAVDERWCLVHATHLDGGEAARLAASGAVAGLCPTTEANLGDGIFPAARYLDAAGRIGIGSDSQVTVSVIDELRLLEYGQRLTSQRRAVLATAETPSPARRMFDAATAGGAQALGVTAGRIEAGHRADLAVLDPDHRALWDVDASSILDAWVFAGDGACIRDTMVAGRWWIRDGRHPREGEITAACRLAQAALRSGL